MSREQPSKRAYDGAGRQRDAEQRRQRVLEAARRLFLEQGFGATSVEQIAQAADTSAPTVYAAFGNKLGVLRRVIDVAVGGDDQDIKLADRPEYVLLNQTSDLRARAAMAAELAADSHERTAPLLHLLDSVAGTEPAARELSDEFRTQLRTDVAGFIELIPPEHRRTDLRREQLADLVALLAGAATWYSLVLRGGWTRAEYVDWLTEALGHHVLTPSGPGRS